jgi:hypothetical protein
MVRLCLRDFQRYTRPPRNYMRLFGRNSSSVQVSAAHPIRRGGFFLTVCDARFPERVHAASFTDPGGVRMDCYRPVALGLCVSFPHGGNWRTAVARWGFFVKVESSAGLQYHRARDTLRETWRETWPGAFV